MTLQPLLQAPYSRDTWRGLLNALFASAARLNIKPPEITDGAFGGAFTRVVHLGDLATADGKAAALLEIEVAPGVNLQRNRAGVRHLAARLLDGVTRQAVLAAFHSPDSPGWRFSFILREASFDLETGTTTRRETPARRFTYLLGPAETCRTAAERFATLRDQASAGQLTLAALEEAFSVERLSDAFFAEYMRHYEAFARQAANHVRATDSQADTEPARNARHFAKRLLARLVFLHFLQKKRWIGCSLESAPRWDDGSTDFLRRLFLACPVPARFHTACLLPLFYQTLNVRRPGDLFQAPAGFDVPPVRIPYLNGGLFEENPAEAPFRHFDFPAALFEALFDFFARFNFTIDESDPLDLEVGVDPEMLGRIFEALLEDNKEKGAYYTPKDIVAYMCREALARHLHARLGAGASLRDAVADWIRAPDKALPPKSPVRAHAARIDALLAAVKVCDPAIGSGAFPMGMLQEIVRARAALSPDSDPAALKLHAIQNTIHGVDLDAGAVDIARLRFWLSLVVDETEPRPLPNLDYKIMQGNSLLESFAGVDLSRIHSGVAVTFVNEPPPAPEFGFVDQVDPSVKLRQELLTLNKATTESLDALLDAYFGETDTDRKRALRAEIDALVRAHVAENFELDRANIRAGIQFSKEKLAEHEDKRRRLGVKKEVHILQPAVRKEERILQSLKDRLAELDRAQAELALLEGHADRPYFLWHLFFHDVFADGGFDIVIGNPPFVRADHPSQVAQRKAILDSGQYQTLWEKWDLYVAFIEKGYKLLKPEGTLGLIVSDAYCHAKYAQKSQEWFLRNARVERLDFLGDLKIFEAAVHNVILFYAKGDGSSNVPERRLHTGTFGNARALPSAPQPELTPRAFFPEDRATASVGCPALDLEAICYISKGMVVHANERVAQGAFELDDLVSDVRDARHPRRFAEGKHLDRWLPATHKWLEWGTDRAPRLFSRPTFTALYEVPEKLISVDMAAGVAKLRVAYDDKHLFHNHSAWSFVPWHSLSDVRNNSLKKAARYADETPPRPDLPSREALEATSRRFSVKYLLAVMNSSWARDFLRSKRRSNIHLYPDDWKQLPIPDIPLADQQPLVALVDRILAAKQAGPAADISALEAELDRRVSALYGLTDAEIAIVEGKA